MLEFFSARGILARLKQKERNKAIEELCELAANQDDMPDAESIYQAVLAREEEMGTGIEEGIAVPHARLTEIKGATIVFGRSPDGIDWNAPDGKLSHFIFLILTPADDYDSQVQILSVIAKAFSESAFRDSLSKAADRNAIWSVLQKTFSSKHVKEKKQRR